MGALPFFVLSCVSAFLLYHDVERPSRCRYGLKNGNKSPDYRKKVFIDYCDAHDLIYEPYIQEGVFQISSGYEMACNLINGGKLPTAIFAASDPIAFGAIKAFTEHGIRVPEDISIVGFDDINMAQFSAPPLTTVSAPAYHMGMYGASILQHLLREHPGPALKIKLPCKLVVRNSCKAIEK